MKIYICDYKKNETCKKRGCFYETLDADTGCVCTLNALNAVKMKDGTPIEANAEYEKHIKDMYLLQMNSQIDKAFMQLWRGNG